VVHDGGDKPHAHVVFQRTDLDSMKMWDDSFNYLKHERASARMEKEFSQEMVPGKHHKRDRDAQPEMPKAELNQAEAQQAARTGMSKAERTAEITALQAGADNGQSFKNALEDKGYTLTRGERGYILVQDGETYALSRYVEGMKARDVKAFMADVPLESLPKTDDVQAAQKEALKAPLPVPQPESPKQSENRPAETVKPEPPRKPEPQKPEPSKLLPDEELRAIDKALAQRQAAELEKWRAWHEKEVKDLAFIRDGEIKARMALTDERLKFEREALARQHKDAKDNIWERIQNRLNPGRAAEQIQTRQREMQALQRRQAQERRDQLALEIQSKQLDIDALKERQGVKTREVTEGFGKERERYIREHQEAQRVLEDLKRQREQELRRDGPEPPRIVK
jgi:hypothetical protein